jgi:hypothetical protein
MLTVEIVAALVVVLVVTERFLVLGEEITAAARTLVMV